MNLVLASCIKDVANLFSLFVSMLLLEQFSGFFCFVLEIKNWNEEKCGIAVSTFESARQHYFQGSLDLNSKIYRSKKVGM